MKHRAHQLGFALVSVLACGPRASGPVTGEATTSGGPSGDPSASGQDPDTASGDDLTSAGQENCELAELLVELQCPVLELCDGGAGATTCFMDEVETFGDWRCVAEAMRDGTAGTFALEFDSGFPPQTCPSERSFQIMLLGDGTAYYNFDATTYYRVNVRPPEHFQTCLEIGTPEAVNECLRDWFLPEACIMEACCPIPDAPLPACNAV